jgi:hypothetical protein
VYYVVPEYGKILDSDYATQVGFVPLLYLGKDGYFFQSLLHEFLAFFNYFDSEELLAFVVVDFNDFAEGASID